MENIGLYKILSFLLFFTADSLAGPVVQKTDYALCRNEYINFCHYTSWKETKDEDMLCLLLNAGDLSAECWDVVQRHSKDPCLQFTRRWCQRHEQGLASRKACLLSKKKFLSAECIAELELKPVDLASLEKTCGGFIAKACNPLKKTTAQRCRVILRKNKEECLPYFMRAFIYVE